MCPKDKLNKLSKEKKDKLMDYMRTEEYGKQNKLNFNPDRKKRGRPKKRKTNNMSGDGNWKSKFCNAIRIDQGFRSIMSIMSTRKQTNQVLVLALEASNV